MNGHQVRPPGGPGPSILTVAVIAISTSTCAFIMFGLWLMVAK